VGKGKPHVKSDRLHVKIQHHLWVQPLRYTTSCVALPLRSSATDAAQFASMFPIQHTLTVPGLHHHFHQKKLPRGYDLTCNTTMLQIDNVCGLIRRIPTQG
jgi:hypothetical protein